MLLFESFDKFFELKRIMDNDKHFYIVSYSSPDAKEIEELFKDKLNYKYCDETNKILSDEDYTKDDYLMIMEVNLPYNYITHRSVTKRIIEENIMSGYFYDWVEDKDIIYQLFLKTPNIIQEIL